MQMSMSKGDQTRQSILAQSAQVFSVHGYFGTSMEDLTRATGLTKGGIYHHFGSKEELALEAFDFAVELLTARLKEMLHGTQDPAMRLLIFINLFRSLIEDPLLKGGCPILNAATEVDDTNPTLCQRVQQRLMGLREFVIQTVQRGQEQGNLRLDTTPDTVATVIIATVEGAIMMSKLYSDTHFLDQAVDHLTAYIESLKKAA